MSDKKQPIAELLRHARDCNSGAIVNWGAVAQYLEAAIEAQCKEWDERSLALGGDDYSCGEMSAFDDCIRDLKGQP